MKKLLLVGAIALVGVLNAQTFGIKAGMNISSLSESEGAKAKVGFNAGAFLNAPIAANFSIQPELLYNSKGVKFDGAGDLKVNLDYISLPVMFQYNATPEFYMEAGPEFSFLMSSKLKGAGGSLDIKDETNGFDVGAAIGVGYYFTPNIGVNARYVAGFTDVVKDNVDSAVRNGVFQVGLSYKFIK